ncbi:hypothetical protein CMI37_10500 [Candidatus Pacearchaeota archaeon]|nr:hypothetical protein [Candidatus Pacearchaeota archaeon]|tara:strand:- start:4466 stop:4771 length:306 start_codon:yes stop_codon:yes gene_type:complete
MVTALAEEKKGPKFKVSLDLGPDLGVEELRGDTVVEALGMLEKRHLRSKVVLHVSQGTKGTKAYKETSVVLFPRLLRKLIANKTFRIMMQKRVLGALGVDV